MTISESLYSDSGENPGYSVPAAAMLVGDDTTSRLVRAIEDIFIVRAAEPVELPGRGARDGKPGIKTIVIQGQLIPDAETAYPVVAERFRNLGFTPMMERRGSIDIIIALEGLIRARQVSSPAWLHVLLLVLTIITTTLAGAQITNFRMFRVDRVLSDVFSGDFRALLDAVAAGAPFALTLLLILGVHEMAHYVSARRHGVDVTLPYFIPFPIIGPLGTLGAVIFIRSPLTTRKALFDVGISGPLAGFVVAVVAFVGSLVLTPDLPSFTNLAFMDGFGIRQLGMPILLRVLRDIFRPEIINLSVFVTNQPIALAAWFGMLLTVLNLLPIGQLDGGHVMYTLFGRQAWSIAMGVFIMMIFLGLTVFPSLIVFALLALLTGLRHPPPGNDITPLDPVRRAIGYGTIALFFLIGTLTPFVTAF